MAIRSSRARTSASATSAVTSARRRAGSSRRTRASSRCLRLLVNGERPLLLTSAKVEYFSAAFYLRNPLARDLHQDEVLITRERFIGEAMQDRLLVQNQGLRPVELDVSLEFGSDFADIFTVKAHDFALGDP